MFSTKSIFFNKIREQNFSLSEEILEIELQILIFPYKV